MGSAKIVTSVDGLKPGLNGKFIRGINSRFVKFEIIKTTKPASIGNKQPIEILFLPLMTGRLSFPSGKVSSTGTSGEASCFNVFGMAVRNRNRKKPEMTRAAPEPKNISGLISDGSICRAGPKATW